jgi:hypothetical protein
MKIGTIFSGDWPKRPISFNKLFLCRNFLRLFGPANGEVTYGLMAGSIAGPSFSSSVSICRASSGLFVIM